jgi:large subunit ribosomal protein L35
MKMKMKNHSGVSKRFKVTGTGKILRKQAGKRHLLVHKQSKRRRSTAGNVSVHTGDALMAKRLIPYPK